MKDMVLSKIQEDDIDVYLPYFEKPNFFLGSKRPDTENYAKRKQILDSSFAIQCNNIEIGILYIIQEVKKSFVFIDFAFFSDEFCSKENLNALMDYLFKKNYKNVIFFVYAFDKKKNSICQDNIPQKGILRNRIFKYGKYYDVYIYQLLQGSEKNE